MRRGVELSINFVIIAALGLIVLVLGMLLIGGVFGDLFVQEWPEQPTTVGPSRPLEILPPTIQAAPGDQARVRLYVYNPGPDAILPTTLPGLACPGLPGVSVDAAGLTIGAGEIKDYRVLVTPPEGAERSTYPCTLSLSGETLSVLIEVA